MNTTSGTYVYITRIIPALSVLTLITLIVYSFVIEPYGQNSSRRSHGPAAATSWQLALSAYTILLHFMTIAFPARVCWAMGDVIRHMKELASIKDSPKKRRGQILKGDRGCMTLQTPMFVIILPAYKEEITTLEETLRVLASHPRARQSYHIYLAMEEKEEKSDVKAATLIQSFQRAFYRMSFTVHPQNIPGEAQGKSSNESWAAKEACKEYPRDIQRNVVITTMDADTHLSPRYFLQIARKHIEDPEYNQTSIYVPPIVFDRNLHRVPLPVRTADLMWAGAGLSSLYAGSSVCIPTSVYSLPMTLVDRVGGWDTDPGAIGEDMHMYLKCFFALSGNLKVQLVQAAASQCDVSSDVPGLKGYLDGLNARYKQALRHMWGSLDTGYTVRKTIEMLDRHRRADLAKIGLPAKAPKHFDDVIMAVQDAFFTACAPTWNAWSTKNGIPKASTPTLADAKPADAPTLPMHKMNIITLYVRLFEAHFLPIHLAVILTTSSIFQFVVPGFMMPEVLRLALNFAGWCRLAGWLLMLLFFHRYNQYHRLCVALRKDEMRKAGMLGEVSEHDGFTSQVFQVAGLLECGLFPIGGFIFGAIPAIQAVMSHVFTDRLTYVVSLKPQFAMKQWRGQGVKS
ncbi:hypothetical protein D0869_12121 [Hortaea werneckii]|uniref:Glycosyltransferase 2-like domain-containing protein n=1 Tax=Hortaea werneckii TaxID=91943 RepID=A0A3M7B3N8_HORWE|nr:hypothetical protein KC334_g4995 [Hortaea werneckii]KAI7005023.1 hypothetical protein KC355_g8413 [Hortaea werneckii]KAI7585404.1 hypothetical protein KC316_g6191 [Hortaea werneckii]RMX74909.1 hypothetical protein D0869_12121 [Hortaea werneckii]RMX88966.1 hypothetical protein D0868_14733 [Hortaea werneckii]